MLSILTRRCYFSVMRIPQFRYYCRKFHPSSAAECHPSATTLNKKDARSAISESQPELRLEENSPQSLSYQPLSISHTTNLQNKEQESDSLSCAHQITVDGYSNTFIEHNYNNPNTILEKHLSQRPLEEDLDIKTSVNTLSNSGKLHPNAIHSTQTDVNVLLKSALNMIQTENGLFEQSTTKKNNKEASCELGVEAATERRRHESSKKSVSADPHMVPVNTSTHGRESLPTQNITKQFSSSIPYGQGTSSSQLDSEKISTMESTKIEKEAIAESSIKKQNKNKAASRQATIEVHLKNLRDQHMQQKFNKELEAYLTVCVMSGMYDTASNTLSYYRHSRWNHLSSANAYNIVMMGHYFAGHYMQVSEIGSQLHKSGLTPTACSRAFQIAALHRRALNAFLYKSNSNSLLDFWSRNNSSTSGVRNCKDGHLGNSIDNCLSLNSDSVLSNLITEYVDSVTSSTGENSQVSSVFFKSKIEEIIDQMSKQGLSLDGMFSEANFVGNLYEDTLAGVQRVHPNYSPTPSSDLNTPGYRCTLLSDANEHLDYITDFKLADSRPPSGKLSAYMPSLEVLEEQLAMEEGGSFSIPRVHTAHHDPLLGRKLAIWEGRWRKALLENYSAELEKLRRKFLAKGADTKMNLYPYLAIFSSAEMVDIMMKELRLLGEDSAQHSMTASFHANRITRSVHSAYTLKYSKAIGLTKKFRKVYTEYLQIYAQHAERGLNARVAFEQLSQQHLAGPHLCHKQPSWPGAIRLEIGKILYSIIINNVYVWQSTGTEERKYRALQEVPRVSEYQQSIELQPHPALCHLYRSTSDLSFEAWELPMVCPPRPWTAYHRGGGLLLSSSLVRLPPKANNFLEKASVIPVDQLVPCMDSLNILASTPWRVNEPMLDVILKVFRTDSGPELDVPQNPSVLIKPPALPSRASKEERMHYNAAMTEYRKTKNEMFSLWCTAVNKLSIANFFRSRIFWFPHNLDFRGRAYPNPPHFSHFDSDLFRSLLQFAEPRPLGKRGLEWLKTHVINLTGFKKRESLEARLSYCEHVLPEIFDSAEHPLTGARWWASSDEPWQTLAACKELHAALHSADPERYLSRQPIHQDGSCNGLQHYAALGRDVEGAHSVNLAPSPVPQDVYTAVATLVEQIRATDAADPDSAQHDVARTLEGYIKRKVVKQTVMTTVYGVTRYGSKLQIEKQLKELEGFPRDSRKLAATYLSAATFRSLEMMFVATKEIQDWFTECATSISKVCGRSVEWVTPLGLPILQPYCKHSPNQQQAKTCGFMPATFLDSIFVPNTMKQRNAFPANFIHSLDASHMMLTALHCHRHRLSFASVHDCYWTHACTVDTMSKICRDQFVALHSQPILSDLSKYMCQRYGFTSEQFTHDGSASDAAKLRVNETLKAVPKLGDFDIELVKKSRFFFS